MRMTEKDVKKEMAECLNNMKKATDKYEKLKWQNIYFWWVINRQT